ncbi:hypothetical protein CKY51_19110 [Xanthomonas maliensis]|nr:hypothetical protein CKY51_19110 [Xanthomonas maliensis]
MLHREACYDCTRCTRTHGKTLPAEARALMPCNGHLCPGKQARLPTAAHRAQAPERRAAHLASEERQQPCDRISDCTRWRIRQPPG